MSQALLARFSSEPQSNSPNLVKPAPRKVVGNNEDGNKDKDKETPSDPPPRKNPLLSAFQEKKPTESTKPSGPPPKPASKLKSASPPSLRSDTNKDKKELDKPGTTSSGRKSVVDPKSTTKRSDSENVDPPPPPPPPPLSRRPSAVPELVPGMPIDGGISNSPNVSRRPSASLWSGGPLSLPVVPEISEDFVPPPPTDEIPSDFAPPPPPPPATPPPRDDALTECQQDEYWNLQTSLYHQSLWERKMQERVDKRMKTRKVGLHAPSKW
eukprot:PhF_6_TR16577/c0_g1_i1/m.25262